MDTIRNVVFIACFLGIGISMLDIMTPSDKLKKQVRFIFSLVFIIAIATPILKGDINLNVPTIAKVEESDEYQKVISTFNENLKANFKKNIENELLQKLEINNINAKEISANINIDESTCININEVNIVLAVKDSDSSEKVKQIVQNEIGNVPVNTTVEEDNGKTN